mmetsp:Transcript_29943/g.82529  ORF Transcript_29943/g.82529 Transcript_29943/m.82529 type:complete len:363 (+) Transcript_29943:341-1429(+)
MSMATSCCASMTYSFRDICRWLPAGRSAPAFFLPMDSKVTPGCTFIVSRIGGCPCCSFEKPSVNSVSPLSSGLVFLFPLCGRWGLLFPLCPAGAPVGFAAGASGGAMAFLAVLPDSVLSCRGSFLMLCTMVSVTFGSLSALISSTQMIFPSVSNVCALRAISSWSAMTVFRSSSFCFSASLALRSFSLLRISSWNFWSRSLSSSSSTMGSCWIGVARGSTFSVLAAPFADLPPLSKPPVRLFAIRLLSAALACLVVEAEAAASSPRACLRTGKCIRAQLSTSPGSGSASSVHSSMSPAMSSPLSWATKHIVSCETTASVAASAAKANAFLSKYFCQRIVPPSMRMFSITVPTASSAPPNCRL